MSQFEATPPFLARFSVLCEPCQWCWWTGGGGMGLQCKVLTLTLSFCLVSLLPPSISFCPPPPPPLLPPLCLCSSGYSLLHVTGEDTWKRIQLQIWHLVARMSALWGKLWEYVHILSPCSRLQEWRENTAAGTHTQTNKPSSIPHIREYYKKIYTDIYASPQSDAVFTMSITRHAKGNNARSFVTV